MDEVHPAEKPGMKFLTCQSKEDFDSLSSINYPYGFICLSSDLSTEIPTPEMCEGVLYLKLDSLGNLSTPDVRRLLWFYRSLTKRVNAFIVNSSEKSDSDAVCSALNFLANGISENTKSEIFQNITKEAFSDKDYSFDILVETQDIIKECIDSLEILDGWDRDPDVIEDEDPFLLIGSCLEELIEADKFLTQKIMQEGADVGT